jgi:hypothetical protein
MTPIITLKPKTVHEIYRKILEYGNSCFHCGITYKQIKDKLILEGYYQEGQAESQLLHLFDYNYHCHTPTCLNPCKNEINNGCECDKEDFDCVENCLHYLSKEGCIDLTKLLDSELNNKSAELNNETSKQNYQIALENTKTSKDSLKIARKSRNLGRVALLISLIPIGLTIFESLQPKDDTIPILKNIENLLKLKTNIVIFDSSKSVKALYKTHGVDKLDSLSAH